jgi:hypothetical protein
VTIGRKILKTVNARNSIAELRSEITEKKEIKGKLKLPQRSESVVKIPIKQGWPEVEIFRKQEVRGVFWRRHLLR